MKLVIAKLAATAVLLGVAFVGSGAESASPVTNGESATQVIVVKIGNFTYEPQTLKVKAGTQIKWVNEDDVPHTVTGSQAGSPLHSSALDTDDSYTVTVDSAGTYPYFCAIHPHMVGTLIVEK
jgi:plastocyanin